MRSFWSDPYLWVHLAGLAAVPICLAVCLVGFAIGDPGAPAWLELLLVGAIGSAPILWMQWQRPFYIFSLLAIALKPEYLTDDQCRLLRRFQAPRQRLLAVGVALVLLVVLRRMYDQSAIVALTLPFADRWRGLGLLIAAIGYLACNLFVQVPVSVASVMLTSEPAFAATPPFPRGQVRQSFSLLGLPVSRILLPLEQKAQATLVPAPFSPIESPGSIYLMTEETEEDDLDRDPEAVERDLNSAPNLEQSEILPEALDEGTESTDSEC
jgi:hypothetical protein